MLKLGWGIEPEKPKPPYKLRGALLLSTALIMIQMDLKYRKSAEEHYRGQINRQLEILTVQNWLSEAHDFERSKSRFNKFRLSSFSPNRVVLGYI